MGKINWGRVFLCGLLTGVVLGGLLTPLMLFLGRDFIEAVPIGNPFSPLRPGLVLFFGVMWFVIGIWTMWLYAAIRPRYGPGPKTAGTAGFALWVILASADAIWGSLGLIPPAVLVPPVLAALFPVIVAAVVGAWPYKE